MLLLTSHSFVLYNFNRRIQQFLTQSLNIIHYFKYFKSILRKVPSSFQPLHWIKSSSCYHNLIYNCLPYHIELCNQLFLTAFPILSQWNHQYEPILCIQLWTLLSLMHWHRQFLYQTTMETQCRSNPKYYQETKQQVSIWRSVVENSQTFTKDKLIINNNNY